MKLRQISENMMGHQIQRQLNAHGRYFSRPNIQTSSTYDSSAGHDVAARVAGMTRLPTGVPHRPRHRSYLGFARRLGAIRL